MLFAFIMIFLSLIFLPCAIFFSNSSSKIIYDYIPPQYLIKKDTDNSTKIIDRYNWRILSLIPLGVAFLVAVNLLRKNQTAFYSYSTISGMLKNILLSSTSLYLRLTKCTKCLTFIDNSQFFVRLAFLNPNLKFLAIQNGARNSSDLVEIFSSVCALIENSQWTLLSIHPSLAKQFEKTLKIKTPGKVVYFESLKIQNAAHVYCSNKTTELPYDVCFISQYIDAIQKSPRNKLEVVHKENYEILMEALGYLKNTSKLKVIVALRSSEISEKKYYQSILGPDTKFSDPSFNIFASYHSAFKSKLIVGMDSALMFELDSINIPCIGFNPTGSIERQFDHTYFHISESLDAQKVSDKILARLIDLPNDPNNLKLKTSEQSLKQWF